MAKNSEHILSQYPIYPRYIEQVGKVFKIYTTQGIFALKGIESQNVNSFWNSIHFLYKKGFKKMIPIVLTNKQQFFVKHKNTYFYLLPWVEENKNNRRTSFQKFNDAIREAASIHSLTVQKNEIKEEELEEKYNNIKSQFEKKKKFFEEYLDECEKSIYMSPFELWYCTTFTQIIQMNEYAKQKTDEWYELVKNNTVERSTYCHGNLLSEHVVNDQNGKSYLISFEKAYWGNPIDDLQSLFQEWFSRNLYTQPSHAVDVYQIYLKHFSLTEAEQYLFESKIGAVDSFYRVLGKYKQKQYKSELEAVHSLQKEFLKLKQASAFVSILEESRRTADQED